MIDLTVDRIDGQEKEGSTTVTTSPKSIMMPREKPSPKVIAESTTQSKYYTPSRLSPVRLIPAFFVNHFQDLTMTGV